MKRRIKLIALSAIACALQSGCSVFSPIPLWELAKATGAAAGAAIPYGPSQASNTVFHLHAPFHKLCIEFNPQTNVADVVPALQIELRKHQIDSRVYDVATPTEECGVWLKYTAYTAWDTAPLTGKYRAYINTATLTLQSSEGVVLSSSSYELGDTFGMGKWASTQSKLAPVVTALVTGFEN
jgi:hypothetical protein